MTFQMRLKLQKHIHIFNCLIKIIARDSLVVAGYWDTSLASPPNSTPLIYIIINLYIMLKRYVVLKLLSSSSDLKSVDSVTIS